MELQNKSEPGNMVSQKVKDYLRKESFLNILLTILPVLFLLFRLYRYLKTGPIIYPDSNDYLTYAGEILKGNFVSPDAKRTPGYPLFIALSYVLFGHRPESIVWLQIIAGVLSQFLFVKLLKVLRFSSRIILAILLLYLLSPLSYIDLNVLTESLTVLLVLLLLLSFHKYLIKRETLFLFLILLFSTFLVFTRPQFIIFVVLAGIYFIYKKEKLLSFSLLAVILISSFTWSLVNLEKNKYFGMTSMLGFNLINHTGYFIELERGLNPQLTDIYVKKRSELESKYQGKQEYTIWGCKDEIMKAEGYNFTDLARELTRIDLVLIFRHPGQYLHSLSISIYDSIIWTNSYSTGDNTVKLPASLMELILCSGIVFMFLVGGDNQIFWLMKLLFISNLIFSSIMERGENFRYSIPLLFIVFVFFIPGIYLITKKKIRINEVLY